jgi:6-phosphofructokinase 1
MKKIAVLTSGGDVPGLNACIRAVVRSALCHGMDVCGVQHGFEGLIRGEFVPMDALSVSNIIHLGGTILKSSRSEQFKTPEGRKLAYENCSKERIDALIVIGGDGSLQGAKAFADEYDIPVMGIPKTIDNDISGTDVAIGFDTALNTAMQAIDKIRDTAESHERVFIVEVMGRDSGYIAYGAGIAGGAEAILVPETKADISHLEEILKQGWGRVKKSIIIVVAEGDETGGAQKVTGLIKKYLPSADRILAARLGVAAVQGLLDGRKDVMAGMVKGDIVFTPLADITRNHLQLTTEVLRMLEELSS